jgi:protein-S-isoprenylcysteine O-methyltransferase Ste14
MRTFFVALRALLYMTGFVLLWGWLALGVRRYDPDLGVALPASLRPLGIACMLLGGLLAIACVGAFVIRGKGTPAPFDAPREVVATGPYRIVRNPMYVGGWAVLFGFGLYLRSVSVLMFSFGFLLLAHLFVVVYEEPALEEKFGAAYNDYRATVPRWIPKRRRAG